MGEERKKPPSTRWWQITVTPTRRRTILIAGAVLTIASLVYVPDEARRWAAIVTTIGHHLTAREVRVIAMAVCVGVILYAIVGMKASSAMTVDKLHERLSALEREDREPSPRAAPVPTVPARPPSRQATTMPQPDAITSAAPERCDKTPDELWAYYDGRNDLAGLAAVSPHLGHLLPSVSGEVFQVSPVSNGAMVAIHSVRANGKRQLIFGQFDRDLPVELGYVTAGWHVTFEGEIERVTREHIHLRNAKLLETKAPQ